MSQSYRRSENQKIGKYDRNLKNQKLFSEEKDFTFGYHSTKEDIQQGRVMNVVLQEDITGKTSMK
jgi:hypothetical protein